MNLPKCSGHKSWTDCGYEYECEAIHGQDCENCLCTYKSLGGLWNPETGKRVNRIIAFICYGAKNTEPDNICDTTKKEKNNVLSYEN